MKTLKQFQEEKLREFRSLYVRPIPESYRGSWNTGEGQLDFLRTALTEQIEIIKAGIPEEVDEADEVDEFGLGGIHPKIRARGFNACRKQILDFFNDKGREIK